MGSALGIEETLEQKPEADRIEIGDGERISDQPDGAEPRPGPTGMPCAFAHWMKSATMRK